MNYPIHTILTVTIVALLASCVSPNMNRPPDRWIKVIDSDRGGPVKDIPIIYNEFSPFGIIVREVLISRNYYSDQNGRAHVPSGVMLEPAPGSGYIRDTRRNVGKTIEEIQSMDTLFVRKHEDYMQWLRLQ